MKIGLIGVGRWGENHLRTLLDIGNVEVVVYDTDEGRLSEIIAKYGVESAGSFNEILDAEGVIIATSASYHYEHTKKALNSGCNVLVEKPLALSSDEGMELVEIAEKNSLILGVGHLLVYHPAVIKMKEMLLDYGRQIYVFTRRTNLGVVRDVENTLYSLGVHDVSILLYLFGRMPNGVSCMGDCLLQEQIEDIAFLYMDFDGIPSYSHITWLSVEKRQEVVIFTDRGVIWHSCTGDEPLKVLRPPEDVDTIDDWVRRCRLPELDVQTIEVDDTPPLTVEIEAFLKAIETKSPMITDGREGLEVLLVLEAAMKSIRKGGKRVRVEGI